MVVFIVARHGKDVELYRMKHAWYASLNHGYEWYNWIREMNRRVGDDEDVS